MFDQSSQPGRVWAPKYVWAGVTVVLLTFCLGGAARALAEPPVAAALEEALVKEDWTRALALLDSVTADTPSPVLRLIKGEAALARNRNDESLCLFMSVMDSDSSQAAEALRAWTAWTERFGAAHPGNPTAIYLRGSALARLHRWDEAISVFESAPEGARYGSLIQNATGVVRVGMGDLDGALTAFSGAARSGCELADAYANLGFLAIQEQEGAGGARLNFERALEMTPSFSLARYGRGCLAAVLNDWETVGADLPLALAVPCRVAGLLAEHSAWVYSLDQGDKDDLASGEDPSMRLESEITRLQKNGPGEGWGNPVNRIYSIARDHPELRARATEAIQQASRTSHGEAIGRNLDTIDRHQNALTNIFNIGRFFTPQQVQEHRGSELNVGLPKLGLGVGVERSTTTTNDRTSTFARLDAGRADANDWARQLRQSAPVRTNPASGFKTSTESGAWDTGGWPFQPIYGLLYWVPSPASASVKKDGRS